MGIVRALADGVDPESGEVFGDESVYQRPDVIRAMFAAVEALERSVKVKERRRKLPMRAGNPWSNEESGEVSRAYDNGVTVREIAKEHQRTAGAIEAQLVKMGRISRSRI